MNPNTFNNIHKDAQIGEDVVVEAYVTIEKDVVIGDRCWIGTGAIIRSGTTVGNDCEIHSGAVVGSSPQAKKKATTEGLLEIGDRVIIREYCTINKGTIANNYKTIIEDDCLLMAYVHVAHDCILRRHCILANNVQLAGHIEVGAFAILGGMVAVHQFVSIGESAMVSGGGLVRKHVPPFIKAAREPLSYVGVNSVGLKRRKISQNKINAIQDIYRILFVNGNNTTQAVKSIECNIPESAEKAKILKFIANSPRGLIRGFRQINGRKNGHLSK